MKILTTHSRVNPLVAALEIEGVEINYLSFDQVAKMTDWTGVSAYYGNLFDEIKNWASLIKLKQKLRSKNVPYVFWNRDAPWNTGIKLKNRLALQWLKPVDIYLSHSMQNHQWFGGAAYYFPNAAQPAYYADTNLHSLREEAAYQYDVSFFGSFANHKDRNARARRQFLTELEARLIYSMPGIRFKVIDTSVQPLNVDQQLDLIRSTKINLNFGAMCDLPGNPSWGLPERVFGIPAAGGYLLTDDRQSIPQTFTLGLCDTFVSPENCARKIVEMLPDFSAIRTRAEHLHREVQMSHTYQQRAQTLMTLLKNHRQRSVC